MRVYNKMFKNKRAIGYVLSAAVVALTSISFGTAARAQSAQRCNTIPLVAHRGYVSRKYTENTMRAFTRGMNNGANQIETDLRVTKDGYWVLMHDASVNRTTNGNGYIRDMTLAQVRKLKVNDSFTTGNVHRVPSVHYFLNTFSKYKALSFQLELKPQQITDEELTRLVGLLDKFNLRTRVLFTSSSSSILARVATLAPDVDRGLIAKDLHHPTIAEVKAVATMTMVRQETITTTFVKNMHAAGIEVSARSAKNGSQWRRVVVSDVDQLIEDNLPAYRKWCYQTRN